MSKETNDKKEKLWEAIKNIFSAEKTLFKSVKLKDGKSIQWQFADVKLADGTTVTYDGDMPMVGMPIMVVPSDGSAPLAPADGILELVDGTEIEVKGGIITAIEPPEAATPPATGAMENNIPATEAAAKKVVESHIKETVYSKQEVDGKLKTQNDEFEKMKADFAEMKKANEALHSANESLTKEIGKVSATNEQLLKDTENLTKFSKELPKLLEQFGATPQVEETEEEKKNKTEAFSTDKPKKMSRDEWRKKFNL